MFEMSTIEEKTAFTELDGGLFHFIVVPFGLSNSA